MQGCQLSHVQFPLCFFSQSCFQDEKRILLLFCGVSLYCLSSLDLTNTTCFKCPGLSVAPLFFIPEKRIRHCVLISVRLHVCLCMYVCFIVMPRTSRLVPCQVVPSQLAVSRAFVLCVLCIQPTTHIVVKSHSLPIPPSALYVCVSFMVVTLMWGEN